MKRVHAYMKDETYGCPYVALARDDAGFLT